MDPTLVAAFILLIVCFLGLSWFAGSDAPFIPTKTEFIRKILKKAAVGKGKIFYELGSGDGRVVIEAAKLGSPANGIEQSWIRVWYSRLKAEKLNLRNARFFHGNIFDRHYFPADIIYIYMLQSCVDKLEKKLKKELKKSSVVITQKYHFKNWKPYKKLGDFSFYRV